MTAPVILLPLALLEGIHLARLIDEFTHLLATTRDVEEQGLARLTPDAYPEDAEASAEFARATRGDLLDRRMADAQVVRAALEPFLADDQDTLTEDDALAPRDVVIASTDLDAWLRTLSALRLVIASRLGITTEDDDHDPEDPRFGVYDWLGYRLDGLVASADQADAPGDAT